MNALLGTYIGYLTICICLTVWVARTLHHNGTIVLADKYTGRNELADSISHLLVVGFYLVNIGFICLALKFGAGDGALDVTKGVEILSLKVGQIMLMLGGVHLAILAAFTRLRPDQNPNEEDAPAMQ